MAVSKRKTSKSKNKMRQAGKGLVKKNNIYIDAQGNLQLSHNLIVRRVKKAKATDVATEGEKVKAEA